MLNEELLLSHKGYKYRTPTSRSIWRFTRVRATASAAKYQKNVAGKSIRKNRSLQLPPLLFLILKEVAMSLIYRGLRYKKIFASVSGYPILGANSLISDRL